VNCASRTARIQLFDNRIGEERTRSQSVFETSDYEFEERTVVK
jgi:hypothetical protein